MKEQLLYLHSRLNSEQTGKSVRCPVMVDSLTASESHAVSSFLIDIAPSSLSEADLPHFVSSNLKVASYATTGKIPKPTESNIVAALKSFNSSYKANNKKILAARIPMFSLVSSLEIYKHSLKFKKVAAILPDMGFIKKLAYETFNKIVEFKPKDVSKFIAGTIHTNFFDYAFDKNIFLTSAFYNELKTTYLPQLRSLLGVKSIRFYATNKLDKMIIEGLESGKSHASLYKDLRTEASYIDKRDLCNKIMLVGELLEIPEEQFKKLAHGLSAAAGLELSTEV